MARGKRKLTAALKASTQDEIVELSLRITELRRERHKLRQARASVRRKAMAKHDLGEAEAYERLGACTCSVCNAWRLADQRLKAVQSAVNQALISLAVRACRLREIQGKELAGGLDVPVDCRGLEVPSDCHGQAVMQFAMEG